MRSKHRIVIARSGATKQSINNNDKRLLHPGQSGFAMTIIAKSFGEIK